MEIKLPENPYVYLILLGGLFITAVFIFVLIEGKRDFIDFLLLLFGVTCFVLGLQGLIKKDNLKNRKIEKEMELMDAKRIELDRRTHKLL